MKKIIGAIGFAATIGVMLSGNQTRPLWGDTVLEDIAKAANNLSEHDDDDEDNDEYKKIY